MSVHARMVGRQLSLNLFDLLNLPKVPGQCDGVVPSHLQVPPDAASALTAARQHLARRQFALARSALRCLVDAQPRRIDARILLAATN